MICIRRFIFFFIAHCFLLFLQIDRHVKFVQQELQLKKNEQKLADVSLARDQIRMRLCACGDLRTLKNVASEELGLRPVALSQFKKLPVNG